MGESIEVKKLKKGDYILYKNGPYFVKSVQIVVTSTHSHTKVRLDVQGLFNGINESFTLPPHDRIETVDIIRKRGQVISKTDDCVQVMDANTYETLNADVDKELLEEINEGDEITFVDFKGGVRVLEKRG